MAGILLHGSLIGLVIHAFGQHINNVTESKGHDDADVKRAREILDESYTYFIPKGEFSIDSFGSVILKIEAPLNCKYEHSTCTKNGVKEIANFNCCNDVTDASTQEIHKLKGLKLSDINSEETEKTAIQSANANVRKGTLDKILEAIQLVVPYKVLSDRPTFIFILSAHVRSFGFFVPFMLLPDLAVGRNVTLEKAAWLASGMGISGAISRVLFGWIADFPSIDRLYFYIFCLLGSGILSAICPSFYVYWLLMVYACIFGSLMGKFGVHNIYINIRNTFGLLCLNRE